jgi:hypothetical protein
VTVRRLWKLYRERFAADRRVRLGSAGVALVVAALAAIEPFVLVFIVVCLVGCVAVLHSPLFDDMWVGEDVDDWA